MSNHPPHSKSDSHSSGGGSEHGIGHVVSPKILLATAMALLVLTVITVLSVRIDFNEFDLSEMNILVALTIALIKASLVCLFFMHLRWDRPFNAFVLVGSLALVALFIWFAMTDSHEYQREVVPGNTLTIQAKLNELPPPTAVPAASH